MNQVHVASKSSAKQVAELGQPDRATALSFISGRNPGVMIRRGSCAITNVSAMEVAHPTVCTDVELDGKSLAVRAFLPAHDMGDSGGRSAAPVNRLVAFFRAYSICLYRAFLSPSTMSLPTHAAQCMKQLIRDLRCWRAGGMPLSASSPT